MDTKQAYNNWASQYDSNDNKTRDLEGIALRRTLSQLSLDHCLEIGCGTGKNTSWFAENARHTTSVDFSEEMLAKAREKIRSEKIEFRQADITTAWTFREKQYGLVSFSLVLEHIEDLDHVFKETATALVPGGYVYIGELHPFKQYAGTKARFDTPEGVQVVECFNHHVSDFTSLAKKNGLMLVDLNEYFDESDRNLPPRILVLLFRKS